RGLAREIAHERQRLEIAGCPIPRELPRRRIGIGSALGGGNDHVIGHEDRGVAELVGLAGKLDQDVGNGERAAARKCETEVHGGVILLVPPWPVKASRRPFGEGHVRPADGSLSGFRVNLPVPPTRGRSQGWPTKNLKR